MLVVDLSFLDSSIWELCFKPAEHFGGFYTTYFVNILRAKGGGVTNYPFSVIPTENLA